jgi:hypothetical protein
LREVLACLYQDLLIVKVQMGGAEILTANVYPVEGFWRPAWLKK